MKVVIIEDEKLSAEHLALLLKKVDVNFEIVECIDTVKATVQLFEDGLIDFIFEQTRGQPWLCNRIGKGICFDIQKNVNCSRVITFRNVYSVIAKITKNFFQQIEN